MKNVRLLAFFLSLVCCNALFSSPAQRIPYTITLANGESVTVVKRGSEFKHWIETIDGGNLVVEDADGTYRLATPEESETFFSAPSGVMAKGPSTIIGMSPDFPTTGNMRSLVILVNFADMKMRSATAHDDFHRMLNEQGYSQLGGTGSARDYYVENSMGKFSPWFDVVGPVELSHGYAYYGENDGKNSDVRAVEMIVEACKAIDATTDFRQYDYNNDGYIDNVFVFYAGRGEATSADKNTIWPHNWNVTEHISVPVMLDGKRLDHYACSNEIASDERMDGIGTFVHEFGHVLGLPDFYPTAGTNAFSPNTWTVMDEGEYNNASRTPPYFTVFERYSLGWLDPIEILKDGCSVVMDNISTNEGYVILTDNPNEFFMLENRQQTGWDAYIPGHGMLVWHIDYDDYLWRNNRVNNESTHQYVDIIEADNIQSTGTKSGDTFPGYNGITSFTADTHPAFRDWSGADVNAPITNIREENGLIVMDVAGGGAPLEPIRYAVPQLAGATEVGAASFVAHWLPVDDAEGYRVGLGRMVPSEKHQATADFTGGISALGSSWTTNVSSTFSNASYSGAATPSLRMQGMGDNIQCHQDVVYGISFWCRGSSVKAGTAVRVEWLYGDDVVAADAYAVTAVGTVAAFQAPASASVDGVRLVYNPAAGSGSVAIDDVCVDYADMVFSPVRDECYTTETSLAIDGLEPESDYVYYVVASKGSMRSRQSAYGTVHTHSVSAIRQTSADTVGSSPLFNVSGQRITGNAGHGIFISNGKKIVK